MVVRQEFEERRERVLATIERLLAEADELMQGAEEGREERAANRDPRSSAIADEHTVVCRTYPELPPPGDGSKEWVDGRVTAGLSRMLGPIADALDRAFAENATATQRALARRDERIAELEQRIAKLEQLDTASPSRQALPGGKT